MSARYAFIAAEKAETRFPVSRGCRLLGVSTSGFYASRQRPESATARRRHLVAGWAAREHAASDGVYGYRRVHRELVATGTSVSVGLVRRVLREQALAGAQTRAYRVTTRQDADAVPAPDLLSRDFTSSAVGAKLVGDITYIRTWHGWAYLAVVIDLATRRVVGWALAERATATLATDALEMARRNDQLPLGAIFHTDRGCQYTSKTMRRYCQRLGLRQSMGRTGVCWDNAQAETFFASLKVECIYRVVLPTVEHARRVISRYIEIFYNHRRRHSALGYQTPHERYLQLITAAPVAA